MATHERSGPPDELLKGTVNLLVLRMLKRSPQYGVEIANRLAHTTNGVLQLKPGSLFPALRRLQSRGWITGRWQMSNGRRVRIYRLSGSGRRQLEMERQRWARTRTAIDRVLSGD